MATHIERMRRAAVVGRRSFRRGVLRATSIVPYDVRNSIVLAGTPRSGTTWLAQLVGAIPHSAIVFEPLQGPEARSAGIGWGTVEGMAIEDPHAIAFLRSALRGKVRNRWTMRETSIGSALAARTWILKEVRINRVLPWIVHYFGLRRSVLLVRNPYSVVASQLNFAPSDPIDQWLGGPRVRPPRVLIQRFPWLDDLVVDEDDVVGQLALQWALDQLVPLSDAQSAWALLGYEALVRSPVNELRPVFEHWDLEVPSSLAERITAPSSVTRVGANHALGPRDRGVIERVCRAAGLELLADDAPCSVQVQPDLRPAIESA